ncbi:hypothetical protein Agub_g11328 [Astrephomene gubernaculifera]|uniref:Acid phosphatase n=1 Tax=Astrephomene gubernaculifera TaxID=47775 RepID=A0AAD3E0T6_9CHLO|nr:hypothetical protein Agub_g11328 [Astrephomene gubernaculifera]
MADSKETAKLLTAPEKLEVKSAYRCLGECALSAIWILLILLAYVTWGLPSPDTEPEYSPICMHATGGGPIGERGSLLHYKESCTKQLKDYFGKGAYLAEVRRVANDAIAYYRQQVEERRFGEAAGSNTTSTPGIVIFDIDETALSNADGFFPPSVTSSLVAMWRFLTGQPQQHRVCSRPHLEFVAKGRSGHHCGRGQRQQQLAGRAGRAMKLGLQQEMQLQQLGQQIGRVQAAPPLCSAPALAPVRELYYFLLDNGYEVVFLTGRSEDVRHDTEANLEAEGYGRPCGAPASVPTVSATSTSTPDGSAQQQPRRLLWWGPHSSSSAAAAAASTAAGPASRGRCYSALLMRSVGDQRAASVFKSEARQGLLAEAAAAGAGGGGGGGGGDVVLAGSIGDQFSDLTGSPEAEANWKLPNPVYTLL